MPGCVRVVLVDSELRWRFSRSGGPGGQHVNTSDTRVALSLDLTATTALTDDQRRRALRRLEGRLVDGVLTVTAADSRSQARNRDLARERLTAVLAEAAAPGPRPRRATRPSRSAKERRLNSKRRRAELKRTRARRFDD
ncbi:aminoacyl-tRNA hydrolase [Nocardiopsis gilva YIM 90087]|uniref:Aminoacyl-tRNA hydrolase n=1 Tax=Nocardiopsis gilva YIM 90087 TaxID=1235441 RepID=A0A223S5V9_9ACTN|nr:alternative ribosome rescue aminoacyl-tRNA hydrolase ArfB [Nocardiopsis gilva]ASU83506.1 aminoacyl-tRNA hydrolase [Nocardiopsis gilva YIM 90087]